MGRGSTEDSDAFPSKIGGEDVIRSRLIEGRWEEELWWIECAGVGIDGNAGAACYTRLVYCAVRCRAALYRTPYQTVLDLYGVFQVLKAGHRVSLSLHAQGRQMARMCHGSWFSWRQSRRPAGRMEIKFDSSRDVSCREKDGSASS